MHIRSVLVVAQILVLDQVDYPPLIDGSRIQPLGNVPPSDILRPAGSDQTGMVDIAYLAT